MLNLSNSFIDSIHKGDEEQVKQLVSLVQDLNYKDTYGWTPFMWACAQGHLKIAQFLVSKGCQVHHLDGYGRSAFDIAFAAGRTGIIHYLLETFPIYFARISYVEQYKAIESDKGLYISCEGRDLQISLNDLLFGGE